MEISMLYFRSSVVRVVDEYQFPDECDVFEREPYAVLFERLTSKYC